MSQAHGASPSPALWAYEGEKKGERHENRTNTFNLKHRGPSSRRLRRRGRKAECASETDFTAFVKQLLANTSDKTEPTEINNLNFQFNQDEQAFDDVLQ